MQQIGAFTYLKRLGVFLAFILLSCVITRPLIFSIHNQTYAPTDAWLNTYTMKFLTDYFTGGTPSGTKFLNGLQFYPEPYSLGLTEPLWSLTPIWSVFYLICGSPIAAYNLTLIAAISLTGFLTFLISSKLTGSTAAGIVSGTVVAFSPTALVHLGHIQLLSLWWSPLAIYALFRFSETKTLFSLAATGIFLLLQESISLYLGIFLFTALVILGIALRCHTAIYNLVRAKPIASLLLITTLSILGVGIASPQLIASAHYGVERSLAENISFSGTLRSFISAPDHNLVYGGSPVFSKLQGEKRLFIGFIPLILAIYGLVRGSLLPIHERRLVVGLSVTALVASIFALGPYLYLSVLNSPLPMPYGVLLDLVQPLRGLRVPARWGILTNYSVAICAGFGFMLITKRVGKTFQKWVAAIILLLLFSEQLTRPLKLELAGISSEERDLIQLLSANESSDRGAVLFWPANEVDANNQWDMEDGNRRNAKRALLSTLFERPIANGYSGFTPPALPALIREAKLSTTEEDSQKLASTLLAKNIKTVVVSLTAARGEVAIGPFSGAGFKQVQSLPHFRIFSVIEK